MKLSRLGILAILCFAFVAQAQDYSPTDLVMKKIDRIKTSYAKDLAAAPQIFENAGYKVVPGGLDVVVGAKKMLSDDPQPYLSVRVQIVKPYETSGEYQEQVKKVLRQNMMKIVRTLTSTLGPLATGDDIAGICLDISWGPNESSANEVMVVVNKFAITPFLNGGITLNEFIDGHSKLMHGNELVTLQF
jgi:hypothetical protein